MYIHVTYVLFKNIFIYNIWIQQWPYGLRSISGYEVGVDIPSDSWLHPSETILVSWDY